ncbi:hypothetical protein Vafri_6844 [Volvox africanus]|uniref:Protein kinase domain-containing protein n=1 Tax=Volvox africanus TaxID=51714 RepID=A0A8J4AZS7_9CHLO|nr:hypothetical protein Vafri_6844 [Volvox africanus]
MTSLEGRPTAAWLAMCFGTCLPGSYTVVPNKALNERRVFAPSPPERTRSSWWEMPLVSKYELIKQIGKGGFSEIWLAEDVGSRERVALKVVDLTNPDLEAAEVANLVAESKFLRSLDCPFLLRCQETDASEEWLVLVLEYMAGGEIMDHIHKVKKYTEADAAKLFAQMVSAISYLHNLNLIHRDIKPENVLFVRPVEECEAEGKPLRIKVIDLGMAALYDPQKPIRGCIGTPGFVSPELWHEEPHAPACDIYALGVVLFIMLTGRKPHSGADIRLMTYCNKSILEAPGLRDERFLSLSSAARELLLAMMADDPRVRPTCMEVLRHPFITAVDSNAEAHREIEESVRRRMRELAQLRRIHGLRFALQLQKPRGADHMEFLQALEQRRLKLNGYAGALLRAVRSVRHTARVGTPKHDCAPGYIPERLQSRNLERGGEEGGDIPKHKVALPPVSSTSRPQTQALVLQHNANAVQPKPQCYLKPHSVPNGKEDDERIEVLCA